MPDTPASAVRKLEIDEHSAGQRVDNFLLGVLKGAPRTLIYRILRSGEVRINGGRAKPSDRLAIGDLVRVPPVRLAPEKVVPTPGERMRRSIDEAVLYEDEHLLVLNKPSGLAVHGGSGVSLGVIEALRALRPEAKFLELVHRLDRDTSGCLVLAKKRSALLALQRQLRGEDDDDGSEGMSKQYLLLAMGRWKGRQHRIEAPLKKNELASGERIVRVARDGKPSITEFEVLERFADCSLVRANLITGRTHQIRVHSRHAGHPIAGDEKYGDEAFNKRIRAAGLKRLFLHAARLSFAHPKDGRTLVLEAPLEPALEKVLATLRAEAGSGGAS